jgi:hypothetical protein
MSSNVTRAHAAQSLMDEGLSSRPNFPSNPKSSRIQDQTAFILAFANGRSARCQAISEGLHVSHLTTQSVQWSSECASPTRNGVPCPRNCLQRARIGLARNNDHDNGRHAEQADREQTSPEENALPDGTMP